MSTHEHVENGLHFLSDEQQNIDQQETRVAEAQKLAEAFAKEVCPICGKPASFEGSAKFDGFSSEECFKHAEEKYLPEVIEKAKSMANYIATHKVKPAEAVNDETIEEEWKEAA